MYEFETVVEFMGEDRPCKVSWDEIDKECVIRSVEIELAVKHDYRLDGLYSPHVVRTLLNVKDILSEDQIGLFVEVIRAEARKGKTEYFCESDWLDREERALRRAASYQIRYPRWPIGLHGKFEAKY